MPYRGILVEVASDAFGHRAGAAEDDPHWSLSTSFNYSNLR